MDLYAKNEKALRQLHDEMVKDIRTVLKEKGYGEKSIINQSTFCRHQFEIFDDQLIIDGYHTDHLNVVDLLGSLRAAYHVLPKSE